MIDDDIWFFIFSYLFLHLRPELVRKWRGRPLNPDSFSPFVQVDDPQTRTQHENEIKAVWNNNDEYNQRVSLSFCLSFFFNLQLTNDCELFSQCTEHLKNVVIPQFVEKLIKKSEDIMKLQFFTLDRLITALHKDGINIRYLGLVRKVFCDCVCVCVVDTFFFFDIVNSSFPKTIF
jgi:hypothetical protein